MELENRLIPILRDGVAVIKMIFFRKLRDHLARKHSGCDAVYASRLSGAIINELFGTPNTDPAFVQFARENEDRIRLELDGIAERFKEMRIPLTDALRVQFLCDSCEGSTNEATLERAQAIGILMIERDVPLPKHFLSLVRSLGSAFGLVLPPDDIEFDNR
ncbi:MAG: hypothetical protein HZA20_09055 [Nitrospirae bacterium]|nr:hypothetical protein [Nitrospirota bacterium]